MQNLDYCLECRRLFLESEECEFCGSKNIKPIKKSTSVNVIGSKVKGKVLNCKDGVVNVVVVTESKERVIKDYKVKELIKVL